MGPLSLYTSPTLPLLAFPLSLFLVTAIGLGLCFGSFLNVVIYRLPREQNLAYPPSTCPACGTRIRPYDNLPVLSWILLRGKARCCQNPISIRYPAVELLGGLLAAAIVLMRIFPQADQLTLGKASLLFALYLSLGLILIALSFIDLEFMILPDSLTWSGAALGFLSTWVRPEGDWWAALSGAAFGYVVVWFPFIWLHQKLRGTAGMGLGDAKLLFLAGAWFGLFGVLFALFAGAVLGTVAALVLFLVQGKIEEPEAVRQEIEELKQAIEEASGEEKEELERILAADPMAAEAPSGFRGIRIAFGPFLSLACLLLLLFEPEIRSLLFLFSL